SGPGPAHLFAFLLVQPRTHRGGDGARRRGAGGAAGVPDRRMALDILGSRNEYTQTRRRDNTCHRVICHCRGGAHATPQSGGPGIGPAWVRVPDQLSARLAPGGQGDAEPGERAAVDEDAVSQPEPASAGSRREGAYADHVPGTEPGLRDHAHGPEPGGEAGDRGDGGAGRGGWGRDRDVHAGGRQPSAEADSASSTSSAGRRRRLRGTRGGWTWWPFCGR